MEKLFSLKKYVVWGGIVISLIFFLLFLTVGIVFVGLSSGNNVEGGLTPKEYQYVGYNPKNNETSIGIVSLYEDVSNGEYLSYTEEDGELILISNFGSEEYYCTGSCYCEKSRRATGTLPSLITRGVIVLVAGVSSIIAIEKARDYFDNECKNQHTDTCPSSSIKSEVDLCESVILRKKKKLPPKPRFVEKTKPDTKPKTEVKPKEKDPVEDRDDEYMYFSCHGNCLTKKKFAEPEAKAAAKKFGCEQLRMEQVVKIYPKSNKKGGFRFDEKKCLEKAKVVMNKRMTPFCKEESRFKFKFVPKENNESGAEITKTSFACTARTWARGSNPSINCRRI